MNSTNTIKSYEAACDNLSMVLPVSVRCVGEIRTGGWMQEMKTDFPNFDIGSHKHFLIVEKEDYDYVSDYVRCENGIATTSDEDEEDEDTETENEQVITLVSGNPQMV